MDLAQVATSQIRPDVEGYDVQQVRDLIGFGDEEGGEGGNGGRRLNPSEQLDPCARSPRVAALGRRGADRGLAMAARGGAGRGMRRSAV